ncbi:MAG: hypothetical protein A3F09_00970 [Chlamydiae bacterium RIFCSPHIGHO2_12_FULL_49_11]|nr:MAG: hypothetical protein A3F09_00970 [Chlamydiae bacterium RIFCSPHIGHO2_12_FULL_49_11]
MIEIIIYMICAGAAIGFFAGLLGIGGGIFFVPALFFLLQKEGMSHADAMKLSIGTSQAIILFTTLSSTLTHAKKRSIEWGFIRNIAFGLIAGAIIGPIATRLMHERLLGILFGIVECLFALYFATLKPDRTLIEIKKIDFPLITLIGFVTAFLSTLMGIGGGMILIPLMVFLHIGLKPAIATSSFLTFLLALVGTAGFLVPTGSTEPYSIGLVYWPALAAMAGASIITARFGAMATYKMHRRHLKLIFSFLLMFIGIWMIYKATG